MAQEGVEAEEGVETAGVVGVCASAPETRKMQPDQRRRDQNLAHHE